MDRRTEIVATIGPVNFSHGTAEQHAETAERVRTASQRVGRAVAILQDLPGPTLRIGALAGDHVDLKPGDRVVFACGADGPGTAARMAVARPG